MITNPKIERKKADIARTEAKLTDVKARLRQQREELTKLEDDEIVAMFRSEVITEDDFAALLRSRHVPERSPAARLENSDDLTEFSAPVSPEAKLLSAAVEEHTDDPEENGDSPINRKEDLPDAISEN